MAGEWMDGWMDGWVGEGEGEGETPRTEIGAELGCVGGIKGGRNSGIERLKFASSTFLTNIVPCRIDRCGRTCDEESTWSSSWVNTRVVPGSTRRVAVGQVAEQCGKVCGLLLEEGLLWLVGWPELLIFSEQSFPFLARNMCIEC